MEEIKPCPWCKSEAKLSFGGTCIFVKCTDERCYVFGPTGKDDKEAIKKWNTRDWENSQATLYPSSNG